MKCDIALLENMVDEKAIKSNTVSDVANQRELHLCYTVCTCIYMYEAKDKEEKRNPCFIAPRGGYLSSRIRVQTGSISYTYSNAM